MSFASIRKEYVKNINNYSFLDTLSKELAKEVPVNSRIKLISRVEDPYTPIPVGSTGTVFAIDSMCQIHVKWDNGGGLALNPSDNFVLI